MKSDSASAFPIAGRWLRSWRFYFVLAAAALAGWLASGLYAVATNQRGVVTRFGRVRARVQPGMHYALPWPIDRVYKPATTDVKRIDVGFRYRGRLWSELRRSDMLTGDENILKMDMAVQYKIRDRELEAYLFRGEDPHWMVERAVESALNRCVAARAVDDVLTSAKDEIQVETIRLAQELLDSYQTGVVLLGGNLQTVSPPAPVIEAFNEVASAKKDAERLLDEAHAYANRVLPQAGGEAQQIVSKAQGEAVQRVSRATGEAGRFLSVLAEYRRAKLVTRVRLYLEAMERVFSQARLIIVDPAGSPQSKVNLVE